MLPSLNRLFAADGRCFDVAVDHGFFNEGAFLAGIEDIAAAVRTLVDAGAGRDPALPGPGPPAAGSARPAQAGAGHAHRRRQRLRPRAPARAVQRGRRERRRARALRLDAGLRRRQPAAAARPARPASPVRAQRDRAASRMRPRRHAADGRAARDASTGGGYGSTATWRRSFRSCARRSSSAPTSSRPTRPTIDDYHRVIEAAGGRPVLVRGGGRVSDEEVFARTRALMAQGAAGIVYGRNVIQHADPAGMTRNADGRLFTAHEGRPLRHHRRWPDGPRVRVAPRRAGCT